jgi:hypothetical protein
VGGDDGGMNADLSPVRRLWHAVEPLHAAAYFAPESIAGWRDLGLRGFWMGYFAARGAPMGAVSAEPITATFFNFHPVMVRRAIPDAWSYATPQAVLDTWRATAAATLQRVFDGAKLPTVRSSAAGGAQPFTLDAVAEAAGLLRAACEGLDCAGRSLAAAWAAVPWSDEPVADIWLAATILREYRGDGHVAALVGAGIDGCAAHVLIVAAERNVREAIQPHRGWSDDDWAAAQERLRQRGWIDGAGAITAEGRDVRAHIEQQTDRLAMAPVDTLGPERTEALLEALRPLTAAVWSGGALPHPNPIGLPDGRPAP